MYRLLSTDIDDTLLAPDGTLPEANREALRRMHEAGIAIVFCSGRADVSIHGIASTILPLADDEYFISFNGARVVTADTRRIVTRQYLQQPSIASIVAYAKEKGLHVQGYLGDEFLVETLTDTTRTYGASTGTKWRVVDDIAAALPDGSPKLLFIGAHELLVEHRDAISAAAGPAEMMFSKPHYLEIVAAGVNKGTALSRLASTLEIPIEETVAVGDAANDVDMIRAAGLGLAVGDAHQVARDAADIVLDSRASDGVMKEIARRFFGL
ncbi:MAG TPA: Cof-type HAD-IIB family hydrolase [Spirochaetia bacterium]|nr:Cof-type HAD-IIB family hydrolase [Spirochaetia bacterium]